MPQVAFTVHYSEPIVRRTTWRYFSYLLRRELNWRFYLATAALIAAFTFLIGTGPASWLEGAIGMACCLIVVFFIVMYRTHLKQALARLRAMDHPIATFTAADDSLTVSSSSGASVFPWRQIDLVLDFGDCWLFRLKQRATFTMPTEGVDEASLDFLRARIPVQVHVV